MNIQKINQYILDCIDVDAYIGENSLTDAQKLQMLYNTFKSEYWHEHNQKRYKTTQIAFQNYIAGLPSIFTVDFSNFDIWNKAVELELLKANPTDKQIDNFLPKWFHIIAFRTFVLMRKNGVNTNA